MPRLQGRFTRVQRTPSAASRLQEIEVQIREILRNYPELAGCRSNDHSTSRGGSIRILGRGWRRVRRLK